MESKPVQALGFDQKYLISPLIPHKLEIKAPIDDVLLHHRGSQGEIAFCHRTPEGKWEQRFYHLNEIPLVIEEWTKKDDGKDIYYSQNTFYRPSRKSNFVKELKALVMDIDCYKTEYSPDEVINKILEDYVDEGLLPHPNIITKSGRGIYLKWWLAFTPYTALTLWDAVETRFYKLLKPYGADPMAKSASQVLRLTGTINSKSNTTVETIVYHNYRYVLREIQREYLPEFKKKKPQIKKVMKEKQLKEGQINQKFYSNYTRNYAIIQDIWKLVKLRNFEVTGMRENILFLFRYHSLLVNGDYDKALDDSLSLNRHFTSPLSEIEVKRATKSAEKAFEKPNELILVGENVLGRYLYSNKKLIEILEIQPEEMIHLSHLIDLDEKQRRNTKYVREKRRGEGVKAREVYINQCEQDSQKKINQILTMKEQGMKQQDIAISLGLTPGRISQLVKMASSSS